MDKIYLLFLDDLRLSSSLFRNEHILALLYIFLVTDFLWFVLFYIQISFHLDLIN